MSLDDDAPDKRYNMTPEQWSVADELVRALREHADLLTGADLNDTFQHLLRSWGLLLLVLAWETLDSILLLVRARKRRVAYALIRPLIEYSTRMKFYTLDADKRAKPWRESGELGPAGIDIQRTLSYRDLHNTAEKVLLNLKKAQFDVSKLDDDERQRFNEEMAKANKYHIEKWADMLKRAEADDNKRVRDMIDSEYGLSGAYLHGDQLASYEVLFLGESGVPDFESRFSEVRIVSTAMLFALRLMRAVGEATGREYGCAYFFQKTTGLFPT